MYSSGFQNFVSIIVKLCPLRDPTLFIFFVLFLHNFTLFYNYIRKYKIRIFSILTLVKISEDTPFLGSKCMNPLTFGGRCGAHLNIDCTLSLYIFYTFFQIPLYAQAAYLDWWLRLKIGVVWICWRNQFNC